jgi:hypothetical protein
VQGGISKREENEMYGMAQQEAWRLRPGEIRQQVAVYRLEKAAREGREQRFRHVGDTKWELERYAGLLMKRLRNLK